VAKYPEAFIQQVAQATDIVELMGQYVALTRKGKEFAGLCPFHDDHRPSMYVSPVKQIFKCFACGAGGGVFQFLMMYEKMPFPDAVRRLAEAAHIPLPTEAHPQATGEPGKNDLVKATTFAASFFRDMLRSPAGQGAMEYARGRGLTEESIDRFGIGYAPNEWDALYNAARRAGISERLLLGAGLVSRRESGGCYDRFRHRLVFPIFDPAGTVVAFGGRALAQEEQAKYLNSPETLLFDKSSLLYGLNFSRQAIVSESQAMVVEGYLDALIPLQMGVGNVVATMGTSLTDRHARVLARYAREAVLVFDADAAGAAATDRALEIFLAQRLNVRVATIPEGKDPCDYCLSSGADALRKLISDAPDALQYVWSRAQDSWRKAGGSPADQRRVVEDFLRLVVSSTTWGGIDEVRRGQLAQHIGHMLNISASDLQQQMRRLSRQVGRSATAGPGRAQRAWDSPEALAERQVLEVLLNRPELFGLAEGSVSPEDFTNQQLRTIAEVIWQPSAQAPPTIEELLAREEMSNLGSLVAELSDVGEKRGNYEQTLTGAIDALIRLRSERELARLRQSAPDDAALRRLGEKLRSPDLRRHPRIN